MAKKNSILIIYYILMIPITIGFYVHDSPYPEILIYSKRYFTILVFATLFFDLFVPYLIFRFIKRYGIKKLVFSFIPAFGFVILIYFFFHFRYYQTEKHLFDPFIQVPKPAINFQDFSEDDFIILALGGSTTRNDRLPFEDRYPSVLESQLQKYYPSTKVRVINAGMDWYTTKHSLINYITYYRRVKPDAVIIMHAINDIYRSFSPPRFAVGKYNDDYSHFYGPSIYGAVPKTFEKNLLDPVLASWFSTLREMKEFDYDLSYYKSIDAYRYYLKTLIESVKQDSALCFVLEQRSLYKDEMSKNELNSLWFGRDVINDGNYIASHQSLEKAMREFNKVGKDVAARENIPFIEVGDKIESNLDFFTDDVHYTIKGAHILATIVSDYFKENNLILNNESK